MVGFIMGHHSRQSPLVQTIHPPPMVTRETVVSVVSRVRKQFVDALHTPHPRPEGDLDRRAFIISRRRATTRSSSSSRSSSFVPRARVRSFLRVRPSVRPSDAVECRRRRRIARADD